MNAAIMTYIDHWLQGMTPDDRIAKLKSIRHKLDKMIEAVEFDKHINQLEATIAALKVVEAVPNE